MTDWLGTCPTPYLMCPGSHVTNLWPHGLTLCLQTSLRLETSMMCRSLNHHTRKTGKPSKRECVYTVQAFLSLPDATAWSFCREIEPRQFDLGPSSFSFGVVKRGRALLRGLSRPRLPWNSQRLLQLGKDYEYIGGGGAVHGGKDSVLGCTAVSCLQVQGFPCRPVAWLSPHSGLA